MTRPVLLDNTVLSNFGLVGRADLIPLLWGPRARAAYAAMAEYQAGVAGGKLPPDPWASLPVEVPTREELVFAQGLHHRLGSGERTSIALAVHRHMDLATDDELGRRVASRHGIIVTGTLGILVACVKQGYISEKEANALLEQMIALDFHSPMASLDALLRQE